MIKKYKNENKKSNILIESSFKFLVNFLDFNTTRSILIDGYKSTPITVKQILPPSKLINEYSQIFKIDDFDLRIDELFKFIDKEGTFFSKKIAEHDPHSPEANPVTSKWIYYNSYTIDPPICCKHYLHYKNIIFKDNQKREKEVNNLTRLWGGTVEGSYTICNNYKT